MYQESEEGICPYPDEIRDRLWGGLGIDSVSMSQEVSRGHISYWPKALMKREVLQGSEGLNVK